jgi:hypothetical protein
VRGRRAEADGTPTLRELPNLRLTAHKRGTGIEIASIVVEPVHTDLEAVRLKVGNKCVVDAVVAKRDEVPR